MKQKRYEIFVIVAMVLVFTAGHYITATDKPIIHNLFRRLYYVPIIWAAIRYGLKGGLITSVAVSLLFSPHVYYRWGAILLQTSDAVFEIILYNGVATVTGLLVNLERKHLEGLRLANIALVRSNQMKLLGEIAAGMAHEVRNPLASLRGGIELIGKDSTPQEERAEVTRILVPEVERIERAIKDFLSYARPAEPDLKQLDAGELASEVHSLLVTGGYSEVDFSVSTPDERCAILADRTQIRSVLLNLALNSIAAMNGGGKVSIEVTASREKVQMSVRDNGPGIDPKNAQKIFEPFFTTRERGLGLGLSIVKRIAEDHGGSIVFECESGDGCVFILELKRIRPDA